MSAAEDRGLAYWDLTCFSEWVWKDSLGHLPNADFHNEVYDILQYKGETGKLFKRYKRFHVEAPREHAKTTMCSVIYPLWRIGHDQNIRVVVVSRTGALASSINREVRRNIEGNALYHEVFPEVVPDSPWGDEAFQVQRSRIMKTPTFYGVGLEGSITGIRADLIILDDPFDLSEVRTESQRSKVKSWIETVVMPILTPDGEVIAIGTRWSEDDYWGELIERDVEKGGNWVVKVYRAIENYEDPVEKWRVLWPERWPADKLAARREDVGSLMFKSLYMNDPAGLEGALFKRDWLTFYDPSILTPHFIRNFEYLMGVDPAISESPEADRTAIAVGAFDREKRDIYVLDMFADRIDFPSQVKKIDEWARQRTLPFVPGDVHIRKIGIEANAYQQALSKTAYIRGLPVIEVKQKKSKYERMLGMQPHIENGRIKFPNPRYGVNWWGMFENEYLSYPRGKHEDLMDALELMFEMADLDSGDDGPSFVFGPPLGWGRRR